MKRPKTGDDGSCPCGTCHVYGYGAIMNGAERGLLMQVLVDHEMDDLHLGCLHPTDTQLAALTDPDPLIRVTLAAAIAMRVMESDE